MAIPGIEQSSVAVGAFGNQARGEGAPRNQNPLAPLQQRQADSSTTQLSDFGRVRLTLDDLQAQAQAIRNFNNPPTFSDFTVAVQSVVQSINALSQTVSAAAARREENRAVSAAVDQRSLQALNEVRRAAAGPDENALADLREIGVSRLRDGTFEVNEDRLQQAFLENREDTVATVEAFSSRLETAAGQQLSSNDIIGQRSSNLNAASSEQETSESVRARLEFQRSFQQLQASQLFRADSYVARNAVVTYLSVASL